MATTAIVLAGAGARGAYEAGVLSVLVPRLREERDDEIVLVGTSAGAINTAILAAFETPEQAVEEMTNLWVSVDVGDVFSSVLASAPRTALRYVADVLHLAPRLPSLLDSRPLAKTMEERLDWARLDQNLRGNGWVRTAGIVATACATGRCVVFVQGEDLVVPERDDGDGIDYADTTLESAHVMASAAIPLAFRPVHIDGPPAYRGWYIDGGVKLNAPIKPSIALGADRVIVVATTPDPTARRKPKPVAPAEPDIFDAGAVVMHSFLVDRMGDDIRALRRVNALVSAAREGATEYRLIPNVYLGPPESGLISAAANDVFSRRYAGIRRPLSDLGLLGRLLGGTSDSHGDLLSFVFFDHEFHEALIDMGRAHAEAALGPRGSALPWDTPIPTPVT